ncbi:cation diffusion facilitator family transporter [Arcobacter nitrofigilis DSM 7299]|uniref:Cation diffusion facilitator family transporter n=1 Tax=Arcobacter nitrofigilis (strain ATCC 33309 / DSM 7299 / CCUG 15893 / LMG 7604 / NCTC 12251 / CI) TaxID=572480 RepID=D5V0A9_ARCNC|nr:cation diffusion facilitator family transporter [Arcobacter nitrofigilis]ADG93721.1 cation diffusion facilitator family transporter [Arcobacter nitrofigilis DSM 7299]
MSPQRKATIISSSVAAILTLIKLAVGVASGSVAVLASAVDSILDMFVSVFNYFAISNAEKPADKYFNYGRGKIEALASVIEGTIISLSGLFLLYQALEKAITGEVSKYLEESLTVMIISLVITTSLVIYLNYIAKKTNNMVIKADSLHYKTDVYTNIAVLLSLVLVKFTGYEVIDIVIGASISLYIIYSAYELIQNGVLVLLDKAVSQKIVKKIENAFNVEERVNNHHLLKTREVGDKIFVEVHLVFDCLITLMEAHKISDRIENKIRKIDKKKKWVINIHMDPYDDFESNDEK